MKTEFGGVWDTTKTAMDHTKVSADRYMLLEAGRGLDAESFRAARYLVRYASESAKPDGERLREYTDANFPAIRQTLLSKAPIYPEFDKTTLRFSLTVLQRLLGADD